MFKTLRSIFRAPTTQELEHSYLAGAASPNDLEMREREISRGRFRNPQRYY